MERRTGFSTPLLATLLLATLPPVACGGDPEVAPATVAESAGVRLIRLGEGEDPALVPLALDPGWYSLAGAEGELADVQLFGDGRLAALDQMSSAVELLSPEGTQVGWIGRPGQGPGELSAQGLAGLLLTDSTILVPDLFQQRITEFRTSGEHLRTRPFPGGGGYAIDWRWGDGGSLAYRLVQPDGDVLLLSSPERLDTLYTFQAEAGHPNLLLPPVALWALREGRLAVATSDTWAVDVFQVAPWRHVWGVRRDVEAAPFTREDRDALTRVLESSVSAEQGGGELTTEERDALLAAVAFPERRPLLAGLLLAPNGDLWVQDSKAVGEMDREALLVGSAQGYGGAVWTVLEGDGAFRARVELPDGFAPRAFFGAFLYGLSEDHLGVRRVARVTVPWGG